MINLALRFDSCFNLLKLSSINCCYIIVSRHRRGKGIGQETIFPMIALVVQEYEIHTIIRIIRDWFGSSVSVIL